MNEQLNHCPACLSTHIVFQEKIKDFFYSQEEFEIFHCKDCNLRFTQNRPDANSIGRYYNSEAYISHGTKKPTLFDHLYKTLRSYMLGKKYEMIRRFKPEMKSILDYGAGEGAFVDFINKKGKAGYGIEPSEQARQLYFEKTGKQLYERIDALPSGINFQVITLWHVLEHIHTLRETIQELIDKLEKNGILVIAVPNYNSQDRQAFGPYWAAWDIPRHLYHWETDSITRFFEGFGLEKIYTNQLPLDPFYISLVSAKYGNFSKIKSIMSGLSSYLHGKKNREEGSTLLTVWMKK